MNTFDTLLLSRLRTLPRGIRPHGSAVPLRRLSPHVRAELDDLGTTLSHRTQAHGRDVDVAASSSSSSVSRTLVAGNSKLVLRTVMQRPRASRSVHPVPSVLSSRSAAPLALLIDRRALEYVTA